MRSRPRSSTPSRPGSGSSWRSSASSGPGWCARRPARSSGWATCTIPRCWWRWAARCSSACCARAGTGGPSWRARSRPASPRSRSASCRTTASWRRPPSLAPTFARLALGAALAPRLLPAVFVLFCLGLFDTVGTLVGVAEQAGFLRDGRLPRAREAMATDALGTIVGTVLGTSTVTAYVESAAGVAEGARTGLASLVTAALLLAALFFAPLARMAGAAVQVGDATLHPVVAPALITVGSFMLRAVTRLELDDPPVAIASFLTVVTMPFTFSISEGIAFGFISYAGLMLAAGRGREVHPLLYVFAALFLARYALLG